MLDEEYMCPETASAAVAAAGKGLEGPNAVPYSTHPNSEDGPSLAVEGAFRVGVVVEVGTSLSFPVPVKEERGCIGDLRRP